ncbi:MAG: RluA family pseudouridine synthase [Pseudomonadota bacterium]|nr:RluA family pseudouridine synthase [Sphingomonas sp.]MDQ3477613.1 RluA family pseudouridine synthase [Pseudomonadota bacterium]
MTTERTYIVTDDDDGIRLDRWFKRHQAEISFNTVSRWARTGQLRVDGKRAAPGDRIEAGQQIRIPPAEAQPVSSSRPQPGRDPVSAEEARFVRDLVIERSAHGFVLNKPPGLATQGGTKTHNHLDRLLGGLEDDEANRPKLVHRLDKDTSGVLLVARSARAAAFFSKSFSGRTVKKVYWALVIGVPPGEEGEIDLPLAKQPGTGGEKMHVDPENGLAAKTRWRLIDRAGNRAAWLELQPLTGRTHQLRAHLAAIGFPIVGDGKYGGVDAQLTGGISRKLHLHARRLKIDAPDKGVIDVTADLPEHFEQSLEMLGFSRLTGDMMPLDRPSPSSTPEAKERRVAAAAKTRRRERRGERRARGSPEKPKRR